MKNLLNNIKNYIQLLYLKRKTYHELSRLSDRDLRDIGINPYDVRNKSINFIFNQ